MGCYKAQLFILNPLLKGHYITGHIPNLFNGAILNIKGIQNILSLGLNNSFIINIISNSPHLFPIKLLGIEPHSMIEVGFINIKIHHAWVWTTNLSQIGITESPAYLSCSAPILQLSLYSRIATLYYTGNNCMALAGSFQICYHLAYSATSIKLTQPGRNISISIIRSLFLLYINQHYRHIQISNSWQHIVGCCISQKLENNQIYISSTELVTGLHGLLLGSYHTAINQLHSVWQGLFESLILRLELWHQLWELWQICSQGNRENTYFCFSIN